MKKVKDQIDYDPLFLLEVSKGLVPDHFAIDLHGKNPDVDTGTDPEDIWNGGGLYTGHPTGLAETMEIFSSSANDTSAGTGARIVVIQQLLDEDGNQMPDVEVTLNGTTPVSLGAQTYARSALMRVLTAGTSEANEGALTLRHTTTTANIFAVMPIGKNKTTIMAYTVPAGKKLYISRMSFQMSISGGGSASTDVGMFFREFGGLWQPIKNPQINTNKGYTFEDGGWIEMLSRTDIVGKVFEVSSNNTIVTADLDGVLVDI